MAITKLPSGRWQVKLRGTDGRWLTETTDDFEGAKLSEARLKAKLLGGASISGDARRLTVDEYFSAWHRDTEGTMASAAWRRTQLQMYRDYVQPVIGSIRLQKVTPAGIIRVIQSVKRMGRSSQTVRHVYNLMHKVFRDAVETHELLERNPVKRKDKPGLEETEAEFFEVGESRKLLNHIRGKAYEVAIWLGILVGRRIGEVQALLWENVDLEKGIIYVRRTYVRLERRFKEYPKGGRWHDIAIPPELLEILRRERARSKSPYVATGPDPRVRENRPPLCYESYLKALKTYCKEVGIKELATHSLRHSTSVLWMEYGASEDDMKTLFAHSDAKVTKRYIHHRAARRLAKVADVIRLFPTEKTDDKSASQASDTRPQDHVPCDVPRGGNSSLKDKQNVS